MAKILIIDDNHQICKLLSAIVQKMGHEANFKSSIRDGLEEVHSVLYDVVLLDVNIPDGSGLDLLPKIKEIHDAPEVIIMTGYGDVDGAQVAIEKGAWDYIVKSGSSQEIILSLTRVIQYRNEIKKNQQKPRSLKKEMIIGNSKPMQECFDLVADAASNDINVLLKGETGTGKELFARAIHDNSNRADKNFVVVDCTALPPTLVESLLFGHRKGTYTGAEKSRRGLVEQADGGTLFLDEIGDLSPAIQKVFLRVLQEKKFRPLGSSKETRSDFRLIAATNRNLLKMTEDKEFRQDLLYRLRSFVINLPPLRNRGDDITEIALFHMNRFCKNYRIGTKGFSPDFLEGINRYTWPGNVRELINTMERSISLARNEHTLFPIHLPKTIRTQLASASLMKGLHKKKGSPQSKEEINHLTDLKTVLNKTEKEYFERLMELTSGDISEICQVSGLSRSRVYERLKKHDISRQ